MCQNFMFTFALMPATCQCDTIVWPMKTRHILLTLFSIAIAICSCSERKGKYIIGVSQCSDDVWRSKMNSELRIAAFYYNDIDLRIVSADDNAQRQIKQINGFADEGVDLLIVSPLQKDVSHAIERAYEKGIPVIVFDRRMDSGKYTAYIGADNEQMGVNMARYLSSITRGEGRGLEIGGLASSSPAIERGKGFDGEAARHTNISIVARISSDWTEEGAYRQTDSLLSAPHPDFNFVFAHNDRMAAGAMRAVKKHGLSGVRFLGIDAIPQKGGGMQMVRDGKLTASYIYPTRGDEVMKLAMDILQKRTYKRENLLSSALITRDNANVLLMQNDEMQRQSDKLISLRERVESATNAFDTQRNYLLALLLLVCMLIVACALAVKAYIERTRYNRQLKQSMDRQKKMTEDMEMMTQRQLRFFTNISHELRTPLTLISGPAEQLSESTGVKGADRTLVDMIKRNASILIQMVNEILEFRKVQNEKARLTLNRFCAAKEIRVWAADFNAVAERKDIKMQILTDDDDDTVIADKEKLAHIYFNLMTNALKYTPQGGRITTSLTHNDGRLTLSVSDTGKGMAADVQSHIFERFYQAADSVGGTGIGLALVKAYTDLHNGNASVKSELGKGSTFTIDIPDTQPGYDASKDKQDDVHAACSDLVDDYTAKDLRAERNAAKITGTEDYDSDRPLLLLVDDNASMRSYLRSVLQADFNIVEAQNGEEGLTVARQQVPQLVVSDVMMPVMDGLQLCTRLKADVSTCHIPVLLLTARSLEEQRTEGYATGADSYITKPFNADTLKARIHNLLRNRTMLRQLFSGTAGESDEEKSLGEPDRDFVSRLREAINRHIPDSEYSVEDLGKEMLLSRVQLYRKVKALTGYSVVDLLRKARLAKARQLLEQTSMSISEIAYSVGFATPSYFAKRFKEEYGKSPGDFGRDK